MVPTGGSLWKIPVVWGSELPRWQTHAMYQAECDAPQLHGVRTSGTGHPPTPPSMHPFFWPFICTLIMPFNKVGKVSKCFPEFCELTDNLTQGEGGHGNLQFVAKLGRSVGNLGTSYL